jgi:glycosyltransferase involved in cell wall biosynthesis
VPLKVIGDGGSNIHIHLIQSLSKNGDNIFLSTYKNNYQYIAFFAGIHDIQIIPFWTFQFFLGHYISFLDNLYKIFVLPVKAFFITTKYDLVVSATDFLPDVIYSFIIKIRNPKITWIASYFLEAPNPLAKNNPYKTNLSRYLIGILYWLMQRFSYRLIKWKADKVLVTSEPDIQRFISEKRDRSKIIVVKGGVDIAESEKYLMSEEIIPIEKRRYDACFIGRFHYQKGCLEMVDIWKIVCNQNTRAKLAMIGNGPLEKDVKEKIRRYGLENNIDLLGFKYGQDKYEIFKQSKIIVHPATYDSGGMAAAEGMACGLPGVSFDLPALKTYYPKGMLKTTCFDLKAFAENIIKLLEVEELYRKTKQEAIEWAAGWNWDKRTEELLNAMNQIFVGK